MDRRNTRCHQKFFVVKITLIYLSTDFPWVIIFESVNRNRQYVVGRSEIILTFYIQYSKWEFLYILLVADDLKWPEPKCIGFLFHFFMLVQSIFKTFWEFILFEVDLKWPLGKKLYLETIFGENDPVWKIILKRHQFSVYFELNKIWF